MHPHIEHLANQAHFDDLRREAEQHRREARLRARRTRAAARAPAALLSPNVHEVLVFVEHRSTRRQVELVLDQLKELQDDVVTALLHHHPSPGELVNESGSHSLSLPTPAARIPAQRAPSEAEHRLSDVVGALRDAGHDTRGGLVVGSVARVLSEEVRRRRPEAVLILQNRQRPLHLPRRNLARRLRQQTSVPVIAVTEDREAPLV
jgi:hypothetical protein